MACILLPFYYTKLPPYLPWDDKNGKIVLRVKIMIEKIGDTKAQEFRVIRKTPSYEIVNITHEGAVPFMDAFIAAEKTGYVTKKGMMRTILDTYHLRPVNVGEKPALPQISDARIREIAIERREQQLASAIAGIAEFYSRQAFIDNFSSLPNGGGDERRVWEILANERYGKIFPEENDRNQLSSNSQTPLVSGLTLVIGTLKQSQLKNAAKIISADFFSASKTYKKLPLKGKLQITTFFNEDTLLIFRLLAGKLDPQEFMEKREKVREQRQQIVEILERDGDPDSQLVGAER